VQLRPFFVLLTLCLVAPFARSQSISSFTPSFAAPGDIVTIYGSGFTGVTNVTFYLNKPAAGGGVTADTQINAIVPSGASTGPITVKKPGGTTTSADDLIVIGPGPYITDLSATNGAVGTTIQINGVHFTGTSSVKFNGTTANFSPPTTDQQVIATIPANATSGPITVTSSAGTGTSPVNFYFFPGVTNFSPTAGRPGTNVVIKGTNFLGVTKVTFGSLTASFATNSSSQITAVVPANAVTGPIRVTAPAGQFITAANFIVQPDISSISPISGDVNTLVTITGANLNVSTPVVRFNGVIASILGTPTSTQIQAYAPASTSSGPVTVQTTDGTATSPTNFYYPPAITGFVPTNGAPGTTITITGRNLTNASALSFNGTSATNFAVVNNTTITAVVPVGATSGQMSVTTPWGTVLAPQTFFVPPVITGFSPQTGVIGIPVTITGTNFFGYLDVQFNGVSATTSSNTSDNVLIANVPIGASTGPITVRSRGGNLTTTNNFIVIPLVLAIANLDSNTVQISWTTNAPGYRLQSTAGVLSTNNVWTNEPAPPLIIGGKETVTNALVIPQKFYRLRN
jgi:hypothetical protein